MDEENVLVKALAAGAAAMFRPNMMDVPEFQKEIAPAYHRLKEMIREQYPPVDVDLLDIGPGSAERQQIIARQLQEAGALENEELLRQAQAVLDIIAAEYPGALQASETAESPPHLR